jgi:hypothetical protein
MLVFLELPEQYALHLDSSGRAAYLLLMYGFLMEDGDALTVAAVTLSGSIRSEGIEWYLHSSNNVFLLGSKVFCHEDDTDLLHRRYNNINDVNVSPIQLQNAEYLFSFPIIWFNLVPYDFPSQLYFPSDVHDGRWVRTSTDNISHSQFILVNEIGNELHREGGCPQYFRETYADQLGDIVSHEEDDDDEYDILLLP